MSLPVVSLIVLAAGAIAFNKTRHSGAEKGQKRCGLKPVNDPDDINVFAQNTGSYKLGCEAPHELAAVSKIEGLITARNGVEVKRAKDMPLVDYSGICTNELVYESANFKDPQVTFEDCRYRKIDLQPHPELAKPGMYAMVKDAVTPLRVAELENAHHTMLMKPRALPSE